MQTRNLFRPMRHLLVSLVLIAAVSSTSAAAQQTVQQQTSLLEPGSRVRVVLARQSGSFGTGGPRHTLQGTVTASSAYSLSLELDAGSVPVTLPMASVAQLEVSQGSPSRAKSAVMQGVLAAGAGALYWPVLGSDEDKPRSTAKAAVGAATGAVVGAMYPQEEWQRVQLPRRPGTSPTVPELPRPSRIAIGAGAVLTQTDRIVGTGQHVQVSALLAPLSHSMHIRGEFLYGSAEGSGSPFSCAQVEQVYCVGRRDETRQYGAGLSVVWDRSVPLGPFRPYAVPLGVGVYHRQTASTEHQEPTAICVIGGEIVACPNNPPSATVRYDTDRTGVGVSLGGGLQTRIIGRANAFIELRAHMVLEQGSYAGSLPLSFGLSF